MFSLCLKIFSIKGSSRTNKLSKLFLSRNKLAPKEKEKLFLEKLLLLESTLMLEIMLESTVISNQTQ